MIGRRPHQWIRQEKPREFHDRIVRGAQKQIKRQLIESGQMQDPKKRRPKYLYIWDCNGVIGRVEADTSGDARALIKAQLGISKKKRLPEGIEIVRQLNV